MLKGEKATYDNLAEWPANHATDIFFHVFSAIHQGLCFPLGEDRAFLAAIIYFFDVMVHVLDQEDVVVQDLLVFIFQTVCRCSRGSSTSGSGRLSRNDL